MLVAPYSVGLLSAAQGAAPGPNPSLVTSVSAAVYWNGANANTAPNPAAAFSWSFGRVAHVEYAWNGPVLGAQVSQAFLVVLFLGFPAYTKQQVLSSPLPVGSTNMTYDLTQFKWYLQGLFQLHAYLEDPNGTVLWSETFYVRVAQPYDLVVATVGLLVLTVAELYLIATVGPRAADKVQKTAPESSEYGTTPGPEETAPPGGS